NDNLIRKSLAVAFISIGAFFFFSILLIVTNGFSLTDAIFEVASAIATVGLSRGVTPELNNIGRVIIIIAMYLGRIGPISMFVAFSNKYSIKNSIHYSEAEIIVG
ncbi:MAG: potassium transporter TrkH, partial [Lachnospiraceae bacterium]|nr:potassium transporter TrkH [Lachnospiraceae bacterium]